MIAAVIPTRFRPPTLTELMWVLGRDQVRAIVLESEQYDHRIHCMWNVGVARAREEGATEIAVLNDDITILPGTLPLLARALRSDPGLAIVYPDVQAEWCLPTTFDLELTSGIITEDAMTGFCFMFRAELPLPPFNEKYFYHYGEAEFEEITRRMGYQVARVRGVPIRHVGGASMAAVVEEVRPLIEHDIRLWQEWKPCPPCTCVILQGQRMGWCERHHVRKTADWVKLCKTRPDFFEAWEAGRGPGQKTPGTVAPVVHPTLAESMLTLDDLAVCRESCENYRKYGTQEWCIRDHITCQSEAIRAWNERLFGKRPRCEKQVAGKSS